MLHRDRGDGGMPGDLGLAAVDDAAAEDPGAMY